MEEEGLGGGSAGGVQRGADLSREFRLTGRLGFDGLGDQNYPPPKKSADYPTENGRALC